MSHKIKLNFMEVKTMKKSIKPKITKIESLYDSQIIAETTKVFINFLQILKKQKVITVDNFLYCIEKIEIFDYNCSKFNYIFFGTKNPNVTNISINQRYINENINEKEIMKKKMNILIKYSKNKNFKKFKKISIEILDYLKILYNKRIGNLLDELENNDRYSIVSLSNIFILIMKLKMMIQ